LRIQRRAVLADRAFELQLIGNEKRDFERLLGVQARIAMRMITILEIGFGDRLAAADAALVERRLSDLGYL
jgi:hypothetical protein